MNAVAIRICSLAAALALSVGVGAHGADVLAASVDSIKRGAETSAGFDGSGLKIYLSDPELGLAGRYRQGGEVIYFEARRSIDPATGAPGPVALRLLDGDARLLAYAGRDLVATGSVVGAPERLGELVAALSALAGALDHLDVHAALSAEKSALANLAAAGAAPAQQFPYTQELADEAGKEVDVQIVADFYRRSPAELSLHRGIGGTLEVDLGRGLLFESRQQFLASEQNEDGELGRYDVYSRVVNAHGEHLSSELGGDFPPADWHGLYLETEQRERSHDEIATEAGHAAMALNSMSVVGRNSHGVSFGNELELGAMYRLARSLSDDLLPVLDIDRPGEWNVMSTGRYRSNLQVHRKSLVVIAEHSATRLLRYFYTSATSGVVSSTSTVNYCNHGACPGGSGMSRKCTYTGPRTTSYRTPPRNGDGTCDTAYSVAGDATAPIWNLWFNHNCHDDSSVQLRVVKAQSYGVRSGRCADGLAFWGWAPDC